MDLDEEEKEKDLVGLLQMSLYGTRDAAANFQREVGSFMRTAGFVQGRYNPCTYWHPRKKLRTFVHGDDFVTQGRRQEAAWLKKKLEEEKKEKEAKAQAKRAATLQRDLHTLESLRAMEIQQWAAIRKDTAEELAEQSGEAARIARELAAVETEVVTSLCHNNFPEMVPKQ